LPHGESWFWRPWMRNKCHYVDLINCVLTLEDVARMNDLLDVMDENDMRARKAAGDAQDRSD
jgi:hypothetical protein